MSRFLSCPASRALAASLAFLAFSVLAVSAQSEPAPTPRGKRRDNRAATPAASPTDAVPIITPPPAMSSTVSTAIQGADIDDMNEVSPPIDKSKIADVEYTAPTTETEILATGGATFTSKDRIAIFTLDVRVHDPKFQLACDKLTVFLNKPADKTASAAATPAATPASLSGSKPPGPVDKGSGGGIDHAIAEGHVIIIQERTATAEGGETKRSVGRADTATFDNKTGDMVLRGMPSVEQNGNTHVATSRETVMTLRRDNSLLTVGPSRTLITQRKGSEVPGLNPGGQPSSPAPVNPRVTH